MPVRESHDEPKEPHRATKIFGDLATRTSQTAGHASTLMMAVAVVIVWVVTGPVFGFSDTWQLVINTGTTIVTFLMVFLIQNFAEPRQRCDTGQAGRVDPSERRPKLIRRHRAPHGRGIRGDKGEVRKQGEIREGQKDGRCRRYERRDARPGAPQKGPLVTEFGRTGYRSSANWVASSAATCGGPC